MRYRNVLAALLVAGSATTVAGCKTTHREADIEDKGLIKTDHIGLNEIRPAVDEMNQLISDQTREGWPPHVIMTPDAPHRPQVYIDKIQNRTREHFDVVILRNELINAMTKGNNVYVVGDEGDLEAVNEEREYSQAGMTNEEVPMGQEDVSGLILRGEITDDVIEEGDVKQHDYMFYLRLVDTRKRRIIFTTSTRMRKVRERGVFGG